MRRHASILIGAILGAAVARAQAQPDRPVEAPPRRRGVASRPAGAAPRPHLLLGRADEAVLAVGCQIAGSVEPALARTIRSLAGAARAAKDLKPLTIDYPLDESIFPPEMVPPTFLWHDSAPAADTWLVHVALGDADAGLYVLTPGRPPPPGEIDARCVTKTNVHEPTPYQRSARSWTPSAGVWAKVRQHSVRRASTVSLFGLRSGDTGRVLSCGRMTLHVSTDPVGAPIFYRDVPLAPSETKQGVIKPLRREHIPLIAWRLRDVSRPAGRVVLKDMPVCANCHSFSADGRTLAMDLDGPMRDKGGYAIAPVAPRTVIRTEHQISWNAFAAKPKGHVTLGLLSRLSPDGRYAVTTLNEQLFVANFMDFRFLQVFYPTRGILAYYSLRTREMKALPGADDPAYVQCCGAWTPDGRDVIFSRAKAADPYSKGAKMPTRANGPAETPIRYDLYRIPFNAGRGGRATPVRGAAANGASNSFPKVSPDGKWLVFVQCRNGLLMRPDSTLWIVPAAGGEARRMRCNTTRMNSWHSWSPNSRWLVFASKANTPYTQMFLTHVDAGGRDSPAVLIPNATAANRAVNLPEFVRIPYDGLVRIETPAVDYWRHLERGYGLTALGRHEQAAAEFRRALALDPDHAEAHYRLGDALIKTGRTEEGAAELARALKRNPRHTRALDKLGGVLLGARKYRDAAACFRQAVRLDPTFARAHQNLAAALYALGDLPEAAACLRRAIRLEPTYVLAHANLARTLEKAGRTDEAIAAYRRAVELAPARVEARWRLARLLLHRGRGAEAGAQLEAVVKAEPTHVVATEALAWLLATSPQAKLRDGPRAVRLAETLCKLTAYKDPRALDVLAAAYAEAGQFDHAVRAAARALALAGSSPAERKAIQDRLQRYQARTPHRQK